MSALLDREPRTLRQALDDTQAQINAEFAIVQSLYRQIERRSEVIRTLEERAADLGDEILRASGPG